MLEFMTWFLKGTGQASLSSYLNARFTKAKCSGTVSGLGKHTRATRMSKQLEITHWTKYFNFGREVVDSCCANYTTAWTTTLFFNIHFLAKHKFMKRMRRGWTENDICSPEDKHKTFKYVLKNVWRFQYSKMLHRKGMFWITVWSH